MQIFLIINSIMYLLLGIWCAAKPNDTATSVGFSLNGSKGLAEFTAVYGGLEFSIGIICALLAYYSDFHRPGVVGLAVLYGCIVAFRAFSLVTNGSDIATGWNFMILETAFFIVSLLLLLKSAAN